MMKRINRLITILMCCICFLTPFKASAINVRYTDKTTNLSFMIADEWNHEKVHNENGWDHMMFTRQSGGFDAIIYLSRDLYSEMSAVEQKLVSRKEFDNTFWTNEEFAELFEVDEADVYTETVNDAEYYRFDMTQEKEGQILSTTVFVRLYNGYIFAFQFSTLGDINNESFNRLIKSVDYSKVEGSESSTVWEEKISEEKTENMKFIEELFGLLIAFVICSIPSFIYYATKKKPLKRKNAILIVIIYGVFSYIIFVVINFFVPVIIIKGAPVVVCAIMNYRILTGNYKTSKPNKLFSRKNFETDPVKENTEYGYTSKNISGQIMFCSKCGQRLTDEKTCQNCETKVKR